MIPREMMEQLRYIELYTLKAARNYWVGSYLSSLRGRGFEFDQHKPYQPGDDYRQIDWNATARLRYPYVKRDLEEKEMSAVIMADLSRSMDFATAELSKRELLLKIAATLAFSAASDGMKIGLVAFADAVEIELAAKKGLAQVWKILGSLCDIQPRSRGTNFVGTLGYLESRLKGSALIFCISDFITPEEIFASSSLKHLVRKHDFVPLIIEDPWEEAWPEGAGYVRLQDPETGAEMLLNLSARKTARYAALMRERRAALQRSFYRLGLDHLFIRTGGPFLDSIIGFFLARKRAKQLRR